mmetsp:Transcript_11815/g.22427  ORF Transcript_11815/g.22427 Transcript_11815/m.22427 type:complete len:108 (-) Transcript_11815:117-440(-)
MYNTLITVLTIVASNKDKDSYSKIELTRACSFIYVVTYFQNQCWDIDQEIPVDELMRDFTIGVKTLHAMDKATICGLVIEAQVLKNSKTATASAIYGTVYAGITKEK